MTVPGVAYSERKFCFHSKIDYAVRTNEASDKASIFVVGKESGSAAPISTKAGEGSLTADNIWNDQDITTKVNKTASTSNVQKVVPVFMNQDGGLAASEKLDSDFSGVLEFDMYGKDDSITNKDEATTVTTLNRNTKESREKFAELVRKADVATLSHSEILALNHLAGNVYVLKEDGKNVFYRQPTDEEVNNEIKKWIEIKDPKEIEIREEALKILQEKTSEFDSDDGFTSSINQHAQMTVLHPRFDCSSSWLTDGDASVVPPQQKIKTLLSQPAETPSSSSSETTEPTTNVELEILKIGVQWVLDQEKWDDGHKELLKTYFANCADVKEVQDKLTADGFDTKNIDVIAQNILKVKNKVYSTPDPAEPAPAPAPAAAPAQAQAPAATTTATETKTTNPTGTAQTNLTLSQLNFQAFGTTTNKDKDNILKAVNTATSLDDLRTKLKYNDTQIGIFLETNKDTLDKKYN